LPAGLVINDAYILTPPTAFSGMQNGGGGTVGSPIVPFPSAETPRDFIALDVRKGSGTIPAGETYTFQWGGGPSITFSKDQVFQTEQGTAGGSNYNNWIIFNYRNMGIQPCATFSVPLVMTSNSPTYPSYTRIYNFRAAAAGGGACP